MRKRDKELIEEFVSVNQIPHLLSDLYDLAMKLQSSAWVDGVNDVWPGDEEE